MLCSILLTFCHLICKLPTSNAIEDIFIQSGGIPVPEYFHWKHSSVSSTVLYCPNCCRKTSQNPCIYQEFSTDSNTFCCIFRAKPFWTIWEHLSVLLKLEFKYSEHTDLADFHSSKETVNVFIYNDGNLTIFPDNICNFPRLVKIDLRGNKIKTLINLTCIPFLDHLNLDNNRIKAVRASSFVGMAYLRCLSLSQNLINYIEPGAFKYRPGSLAYINLKGNFLTTVDISNIVLGYFFVDVNFQGNQISRITNKLNRTGFPQEDIIGGGFINLMENNLTYIPTLSQLGIEDIKIVWRGISNYRFYVGNNPWSCDCELYPYMFIASSASRYYDLEFSCASPSSLVGYSLENFRKNPALFNHFICNISLEDKCPPKCYCYKQPYAKRVVVNCSSTDRSMMPKVVPHFDDLDIDLSYNLIKVFQNFNYLNRAIRIDLSYNRITFIDPDVYGIERLNFINLAHHRMTSLDRSVQVKDPCKLWFGNVSLTKCNCEMRLIKVWLQRQIIQKCKMENVITCQKSGESIDLMLLSENDLCPIKQSNVVFWWFVGVTFLILIKTLLYYNFIFEIKLLFRMLKLYLHCNKSRKDCYEYDLYVSFNMDNDDVRCWTVRTLTTFFENQGYTLCLPPRDFNFGTIQYEEICTNINTSKSFVVVLSKDNELSQFQKIEWKHIWNTFMTDSLTTITVINYDFLTSKEIRDRKLKSFQKLGHFLKFYNFHENLLHDIKNNIGPPIHKERVVF